MIAVTHFKGHPLGVFGGAMKNIGIGCGSKRGKLCTHTLNHPLYGIKNWQLNPQAAAAAGQGPHPNLIDRLIDNCPWDCFSLADGVLKWNKDACIQCAGCFGPGLFTGILGPAPEMFVQWATTIPDACAGYIDAIGKDHCGYVNYAVDISPWCDCANFSDRPLVQNIGVFASKDPVAIDMACLEATEHIAANAGSKADDLGFGEPGTERFTNCGGMAGVSQWAQINSGVYNRMGSSEYELITSKPGDETDFWMKPYTPSNVWGKMHRKGIRKQDWHIDYPYTHKDLQLSMVDLSVKPTGKVGEKEL
jgi:uncharacterized Fe-S center protein